MKSSYHMPGRLASTAVRSTRLQLSQPRPVQEQLLLCSSCNHSQPNHEFVKMGYIHMPRPQFWMASQQPANQLGVNIYSVFQN